MAALQRGSDCKEDSHQVNAMDNLLSEGMRLCDGSANDNLPSVGMHQAQNTIMVQGLVTPCRAHLSRARPVPTA